MCETEILKMDSSHISAVAQIEQCCFSQPWSEKALEDELTNDSALFFVAVKNGKVAGYIGMHTVLDECYIANIAVFPEFRRQGIADSLLCYAHQKATDAGCSFISLEVRVSNVGAIALYEKHGYESQGERKNFYSQPTENALIMTKYFNKE